MRYRRGLLPLLALACTLPPLGCVGGHGVTQVRGTVTLDNVPLDGADLMFLPENPADLRLGAFGGHTGRDGQFAIALGPGTGRNAKPGRFVVVITKGAGVGLPAPAANEEDRTKGLMKLTAPGASAGTLPGVYADRDRSPFKVEIREGANEVGPFHLHGRPEKR